MKHSKPEAPEETNAAGNPLPRNWISVIAIIWCGQALSIFATVAASTSQKPPLQQYGSRWRLWLRFCRLLS